MADQLVTILIKSEAELQALKDSGAAIEEVKQASTEAGEGVDELTQKEKQLAEAGGLVEDSAKGVTDAIGEEMPDAAKKAVVGLEEIGALLKTGGLPLLFGGVAVAVYKFLSALNKIPDNTDYIRKQGEADLDALGKSIENLTAKFERLQSLRKIGEGGDAELLGLQSEREKVQSSQRIRSIEGDSRLTDEEKAAAITEERIASGRRLFALDGQLAEQRLRGLEAEAQAQQDNFDDLGERREEELRELKRLEEEERGIAERLEQVRRKRDSYVLPADVPTELFEEEQRLLQSQKDLPLLQENQRANVESTRAEVRRAELARDEAIRQIEVQTEIEVEKSAIARERLRIEEQALRRETIAETKRIRAAEEEEEKDREEAARKRQDQIDQGLQASADRTLAAIERRRKREQRDLDDRKGAAQDGLGIAGEVIGDQYPDGNKAAGDFVRGTALLADALNDGVNTEVELTESVGKINLALQSLINRNTRLTTVQAVQKQQLDRLLAQIKLNPGEDR